MLQQLRQLDDVRRNTPGFMPRERLRVSRFAQTFLAMRDIFPACSSTRGGMTVPKDDKFKDYTRYAEHCLNLVASTGDQESRCVQREMAAEWLRLADLVRRPRRSKQMQME